MSLADSYVPRGSNATSSRFRFDGVRVVLIALASAALACGVTTNDISYSFAAIIGLLGVGPQLQRPSRGRILIVSVTLFLVVFGSLRGYLRGNEIEHIGRFALPLLTFAVFCLLPGLGLRLYRQRHLVGIIILLITILFFYTVKTGNFELADSIMTGWTLTYSSNAGIGVWHYFAIPFCVCLIGEGLSRGGAHRISLLFGISGIFTIILLWYLTDTSSFSLSIVLIALVIITPGKVIKFITWPIAFILIFIIFDFFTFKITAQWILGELRAFGTEDVGDILRVIQLEYFVENSELFGSGFGARHDFPFELNQARQLSQIIYPYASELPILNIIFNGGVLAALWFSFVISAFAQIIRSGGSKDERSIRHFAIGCLGVLVGSLSNPYLFAPASMLLLAIAFDLADTVFLDHSRTKVGNDTMRGPRKVMNRRQFSTL